MKIKLFLIICFLKLPLNLLANIGEQIFQDSLLHEIKMDITLGENWIDTLYEDYYKSNQDPLNIPEIYRIATNVRIDGQLLPFAVGVKVRGNFSVAFNKLLQKKKLPLKISFNEFSKNTYDGLKKLNLNTNTNDPSFLHEKLSYKLMETMGQPAPRCAYCKLYVNNEYRGLYMLVENLDKTFLKRNYGGSGNDGNLYRSLTSNLDWHENDKEKYKAEFDLKTNEKEDNWERLIHFINIINNGSKEKIQGELENIFDVENFLKIVAIEKMVVAWDNYSYSGRNFSLYERNDGRLVWLPWDYNESFQISDGLLPQSYLIPKLKRPLLKAIFEQPAYRNRYLEIVCEILDKEIYSIESLSPQINLWHNLIDEAYYLEKNPLSSYQKFKTSLFDQTKEDIAFPQNGIKINFVKYSGLFPFIAHRLKWVSTQMELQEFNCPWEPTKKEDNTLKIFPNPSVNGQDLIIKEAEWINGSFNKFEIFNTSGQIVYNGNWEYSPSSERKINLSEIPPGFYFIIKTDADEHRSIGKIIILDN